MAQDSHEPVDVGVRFTVLGEGTARHVRVEGRLAGDAVLELDELIRAERPSPWLDLSELRSADAAGLTLLRRLRAEGAVLRNIPPHIAWRLE